MIRKAKSQKESFIETSRKLGCDEDPKTFERVFSKVVPAKTPSPSKAEKKKRPEAS